MTVANQSKLNNTMRRFKLSIPARKGHEQRVDHASSQQQLSEADQFSMVSSLPVQTTPN